MPIQRRNRPRTGFPNTSNRCGVFSGVYLTAARTGITPDPDRLSAELSTERAQTHGPRPILFAPLRARLARIAAGASAPPALLQLRLPWSAKPQPANAAPPVKSRHTHPGKSPPR